MPAYADFVTGLGDVTVADTADYLGDLATEEARPTGPDGTDGKPTIDTPRLRGPGEALLERAGVALPDPADHQVDGQLDLASYVEALGARVRAIDASFTSRPIDALAAAYPYLASAAAPVTTGPFQLPAGTPPGAAAIAAGDLMLAANPTYLLGRPALDRLVVRRVASDAAAAAALADGSLDWRPGLTPASYAAVRDAAGVQVASYPDFGFYGLTFNLHPDSGGLFLDKDLRQAVALCFDHAAAVDAAVGDDGVAIDTEIPTMSWAYPTTGLTTYPLDRGAGHRPHRGRRAGRRDAGGIYEKGGRRLSTVVPVREGFPERTAWLRAVSEAVRGLRHRPEGRRGRLRRDPADARGLSARQCRRARCRPAVRRVLRGPRHRRGSRSVPAVPLVRVHERGTARHVQLRVLPGPDGGSPHRGRATRPGSWPRGPACTRTTRPGSPRTCR